MKKLFFLIILFSNAWQLQAQQNTSTVRGFIYDNNTGESVVNVKVYLLSQDSVLLGGANTDVDGLFSIGQLAPGIYTIQVNEVGYDLKILSDVVLEPNKKTDIIIELKEKTQKLAPVLSNPIHCRGPKVAGSEKE